jgi:heptosyltransferase II
LLINNGFIGDSLLVLPLLTALRKAYPETKISVLLNPVTKSLFDDNKNIDKIYTYTTPWFRYSKKREKGDVQKYLRLRKTLREQKFDWAIDARGDLRNNLLILYASGAKRRIGFSNTGGKYLLTDDVGWTTKVSDGVNSNNIAHYLRIPLLNKYPSLRISQQKKIKGIALVPGAGYPLKEWDVSKWQRVADHFGKEYKIFVVGGKNDKRNIFGKNIVDCTDSSLVENAALLAQVSLTMGVDAGGMHVAAAAGSKTLTLFGPTDEFRWAPFGEPDKHHIITINQFCSPCGLLFVCPYKHECMDRITVEQVIKKAEDMLGKSL